MDNGLTVMKMETKMSKDKISRLFTDVHGQLYGLYGCTTQGIGLFKITKELKHDYKGYLCRCSHEYWKENHFKEVAR